MTWSINSLNCLLNRWGFPSPERPLITCEYIVKPWILQRTEGRAYKQNNWWWVILDSTIRAICLDIKIIQPPAIEIFWKTRFVLINWIDWIQLKFYSSLQDIILLETTRTASQDGGAVQGDMQLIELINCKIFAPDGNSRLSCRNKVFFIPFLYSSWPWSSSFVVQETLVGNGSLGVQRLRVELWIIMPVRYAKLLMTP